MPSFDAAPALLPALAIGAAGGILALGDISPREGRAPLSTPDGDAIEAIEEVLATAGSP